MNARQRPTPHRDTYHRDTPHRRGPIRTLFALAAALLAGAALAQAVTPTVQVRYDAKLGYVLTDGAGMSLYLFANDTAGKSACNGACAVAWPPLLADAVGHAPLNLPGTFSLVTRDDGSKQVAYDGHPLYLWQGDKKPGDMTGQGVRGVWWVANLEPAVQVLDTAKGPVLVGPTGMTLYTFAKDTANASNCSGTCATNWPPLVGGYDPAHGNAPVAGAGVQGTLGVIQRADGSMQVTLGGKPLYFFRDDTVPGQTSGDGLLGLWQTAKP